jgi:peptidyl-prolyl cis-trans isomerase SurA
MQNLKKQLENKQVDWCAAAKKSDDPGSRDRCGQYQINRNEKTWDPVFLATAFRLKEGEISAPVKSNLATTLLKWCSAMEMMLWYNIFYAFRP